MTPAELQHQLAGTVNFALQNGCTPADAIAQLEMTKFTVMTIVYDRSHRQGAEGPRIVPAPNGLKVN